MNLDLCIIIPCYNSEKTILRCLNSVPKSCGIETIVVDDCSQDNTVNLIKKYISQYGTENLKLIINEVNQGPGKSRNNGISSCTKKYITFLDSDDTLMPNFASSLNDLLLKEYDCIIFDALKVNKIQKRSLPMFFSDIFSEGTINNREAFVFVRGCTWGKIYRADIIHNNKILFADSYLSEDLVFTKIAIVNCNYIYYLHKALYTYVYNENSITNNTKKINVNVQEKAFELIQNKLKNRGLEKELNSVYFHEVVYWSTTLMLRIGESNHNCRQHFKKVVSEYNVEDPYRHNYILKDKIVYRLYRTNLYGIVKILLKVRK